MRVRDCATGNELKMADAVEELREFLLSLNGLVENIKRFRNIDDINGLEHCKRKLENYISILTAIAVNVLENTRDHTDTSLQVLVEDLVSLCRQKLQDLTVYFNNIPVEEGSVNSLGFLPSTGG